MKKLSLLVLASAVSGGAFAQSIYAPTRSVGDQGIALMSWGSGTISQATDVVFEGAYSLRVSTRNYFQGGIVTLKTPIDLAGAAANNNNLLRFAYRVAGSGLQLNANTGAGGAKGGGPTAGGAGAGGGTGGFDEGGGGTKGGSGTAAKPTVLTSDAQLSTVRVIVTTSDGKKSEAFVNINPGDSWRSIAVPLAAINGFARTNKQVTSVAFSGDATATFYVGDVRVVNDSTPITGDMLPKQDQNLALGDEVTFTGNGFAGSTMVKYSWDFDSADGIQEDAAGQQVKRKFRKPGDFVVTLTISDLYGAKTPVIKTIKVHVNP